MTDKKSDLDLDFGDISSKQPEAPPVAKAPEPEAKTIERSGIFLPVPTKNGYMVRELEDCTGEEFLLWAESVCYNIRDKEGKEADPKDFDRYKIRARMWKKIEAFHKRLSFSIPGIMLPPPPPK